MSKVLFQPKDSSNNYDLPQKLFGVIGWPLQQTRSPLLHNIGFRQLSLPYIYMAWPVQPNELEKFLVCMRVLHIEGCSVTIPHKISILSFLDCVSEAASLAGAVNTLYWNGDYLCGDNTDVTGFIVPLANFPLDKTDALLLGAGGAAHAVAAALRLNGCRHVRVTSPSNTKQYMLSERFGFNAINWEDRYSYPATLVINTTPLGMEGEYVSQTPYDFSIAPKVKNAIAYDLVYNPSPTVFLRQAEEYGRFCISGIEMFLGQGDRQFEIWTGQHLPEAARQSLLQYYNQ